MMMATAISIPTAPVVPAIRHMFLVSGSMAGVPVTCRAAEIKARAPAAPLPRAPRDRDPSGLRDAPGDLGQDLFGGGHETLDVGRRVRQRQEGRLELRRR